MLRKSDTIPNFIKQLGERFFSYILNIEEEKAKELLSKELEISEKQNEVVDSIISICRQWRTSESDQQDVNFLMYLNLQEARKEDGIHMLNYLRAECEGELPIVNSKDKLVNYLQLLAVEAYPAFLLNKDKRGLNFNKSKLYNRNEFSNEINEMVLEDEKLQYLFNIKGDSEFKTVCTFNNSTGLGGSVKLGFFIDLVLFKSYVLMVLSGNDDIYNYILKIEEYIDLLRNISIDKKVTVPVFMGYSNVAFPEETDIKTPQGELKSFDKTLLTLLPNEVKPRSSGKGFFGFVYSGEYLYSIENPKEGGKIKWPKELDEERKRLDLIDENLKLSICLSARRETPLSLENQWTIIFDPLSFGVNLSYNNRRNTPTIPHVFLKEESLNVKVWLERIDNAKDDKIRLSIRKLINSISTRNNPIDGFIDAIITWENLFGANAELSFRISTAISCLIEPNKGKRKELYKKIKKAYDTRSSIVHGVKEIDYQKASDLKDFAVNIGLDCFSELYENHQNLIDKEDKSLTILLEH